LSWLDDRRVLFSEIKGTGLHMGVASATETRADHREIYFPTHERSMAHYSYPSPDRHWMLVVEMDSTAAWQPCRLIPSDGSTRGMQVGPEGRCSSAGWSPDGKWMYFSAYVSGVSHVWRQRFPDGSPEQITFGPTEESGIAMAPDGRSLVTSVGMRQTEVWFHDSTGERAISSEGLASLPRLSADAGRLYHLVRQDSLSSSFDLRVLDLASGKAERLLPDFSVEHYAISPDETEVVFTVQQTPGKPEIWLAPLQGGAPPHLVARGGDRAFFGRNGDLIVRLLGDQANFLYRVKTDGTGHQRISDVPILNHFGTSPDGEWALVFAMTGTPASPDTIALPVNGGAPVLVCPFFCPGGWSANGRFLYLEPGMGRTIVLPVPPGHSLPELPPNGIGTDGANVPETASVIEQIDVFPGPDFSTYAYQVSKVHHNLFRVPLR
jgi:hypothetical protein